MNAVSGPSGVQAAHRITRVRAREDDMAAGTNAIIRRAQIPQVRGLSWSRRPSEGSPMEILDGVWPEGRSVEPWRRAYSIPPFENRGETWTRAELAERLVDAETDAVFVVATDCGLQM